MSTMLLPSSWRPSISPLLPADAATYHGPAARLVGARSPGLIVITVRRPDPLAAGPTAEPHSIATIDIAVVGGSNIVALFRPVGGRASSCLAALLWILLLHYRGLVPLVLAVFAAEPCPARPWPDT